MNMTPEQLEIRSKANEKKAFDAFLQRPSTRLLISMIPAAEQREALTTLLEDAHSTGWSCGSASALVTILECVIKRPPL